MMEILIFYLQATYFTSEVETTRNDASYGLVLTGNGDGTFVAKKRIETGFYAPSDVKKIK